MYHTWETSVLVDGKGYAADSLKKYRLLLLPFAASQRLG